MKKGRSRKGDEADVEAEGTWQGVCGVWCEGDGKRKTNHLMTRGIAGSGTSGSSVWRQRAFSKL